MADHPDRLFSRVLSVLFLDSSSSSLEDLIMHLKEAVCSRISEMIFCHSLFFCCPAGLSKSRQSANTGCSVREATDFSRPPGAVRRATGNERARKQGSHSLREAHGFTVSILEKQAHCKRGVSVFPVCPNFASYVWGTSHMKARYAPSTSQPSS